MKEYSALNTRNYTLQVIKSNHDPVYYTGSRFRKVEVNKPHARSRFYPYRCEMARELSGVEVCRATLQWLR